MQLGGGASLTSTLVQEVGQQTPHDGLMTDDQDILLPLQLHDDWLQAVDQVLVRLKHTGHGYCLCRGTHLLALSYCFMQMLS